MENKITLEQAILLLAHAKVNVEQAKYDELELFVNILKNKNKKKCLYDGRCNNDNCRFIHILQNKDIKIDNPKIINSSEIRQSSNECLYIYKPNRIINEDNIVNKDY